ncbi:hypothetical protein LJB42_004333 [Komagataella kurtzmanii]|nr:hypothetical protein LJB42_004333 [Komagataella kurtzmanii]
MYLGRSEKDAFKPKKNRILVPRSLAIYLVISVLLTNFLVFQLFNINLIPFLNGRSSKNNFDYLVKKEFLNLEEPYRGFYKEEIENPTNYFFPTIEHASRLNEMGLDNLFQSTVDKQTKVHQYMLDPELKYEDQPKGNELDFVRREFLSNGMKVHRGANSPELVIVTGIDFETFDSSYLGNITQNRIDYAQKYNFGVYVRWVQEFAPQFNNFQQSKDWTKALLMRAAMLAFPNTKYFWYIDSNCFIMNMETNIIPYILEPHVLGPIILRDHPLILPDGGIKTYANIDPKDVHLILTQSATSIRTDSFVMVNSIYSKALLEYLSDPLFTNFSTFAHGFYAGLTHLLQWHPYFLSKAVLIPQRTIAAEHSSVISEDENDMRSYHEGDLLLLMPDCVKNNDCAKILESYTKKKKSQS